MFKSNLLFLLGFLSLALSQQAIAKDYALFFACNSYQNLHLRDLNNPIKNAQEIGKILERDYGFEVEILTNPSLEEIDQKLREYDENFAKGIFESKGQLLVFFSGHGEVDRKTGFFLPSDADPKRLNYTALSYPYWHNFINEIPCQHILVAIDACFSVRFDPAWEARSNNPSFGRIGEQGEKAQMLSTHSETKTRIFFTSDGKESETPDRSNFAKKFQEGLLGKGGSDRILTSTELYAVMEHARPRPYCKTFGDDKANSSFLFTYQGLSTKPNDPQEEQSAFLDALDCGIEACLKNFLHNFPNSTYASIVQTKIEELLPYPKMIPIPGGIFMMGSKDGGDREKPAHEVTISSFELAETEVTNEQYMAFVQATNSHHPEWMELGNDYNISTGTHELYKILGDALTKDNHPVVGISWRDAQAYCKWLSQETGKNYRLPTEAEWEYAAGGGSLNRSKWAGTNSETSLRSYANFSGTHGKDRFTYTAPVKSFEANPLGLYDMSGNVWEWCADWYGSNYYANSPSNNPQGPASGSGRVYRGGSCYYSASYLRVAYRSYGFPVRRNRNIGFRPARTP